MGIALDHRDLMDTQHQSSAIYGGTVYSALDTNMARLPISTDGPELVQDSSQTERHRLLNPENICTAFKRQSLAFPEIDSASLQAAGAEVYGHVQAISQQAVHELHSFYQTQQQDLNSPRIPERVLHAFVELYYEHFDSQFPFLHPSRLEAQDLRWILLLAAAAVGSHYSEIQGAREYNLALCDLLARAVESVVSGGPMLFHREVRRRPYSSVSRSRCEAVRQM